MKQHPIWQSVKRLLYDHDCVIIPGFGGFVCNKQSAKIDQVSHLITPPGKHVVFNQNLKNNDGLLANEIAQTQQLTYSDALKWIEQTIEQIKSWLAEQKQLEIEDFGRFRLNTEANYVFIPHIQNNYLYSSYGLMPLQAAPVASRTIKTPRTKIFRDRSIVKHPRNKKSRIFWPAALATFIGLLLIANAWIYLNNHSTDQQKINDHQLGVNTWFDSLLNKDNTPEEETKVETIIESETNDNESITKAPTVDAGENSNDALSVANSLVLFRKNWIFPPFDESYVELTKEVTELATLAPTFSRENKLPNTKKYYIIAGVFWVSHNAEKYARLLQIQGYDVEIVETNCPNCKRVSVSSFYNKQEAEKYLREIQATLHPDAWIYTIN